jgi:Septum formation
MSDAPDDRVTGRGEDEAGEEATPSVTVPEPPMLLPPPPPGAGVLPETAVLPRAPAPLERPAPPEPPAPLEAPAAARVANPAAAAAVIVGIVALLTGVFPFTAPLGVLLAILALVLGAIGITQVRRANATGLTLAVIGMVVGFLGLIAASVWLGLWHGLNSAAEQRAIRSNEQIEAEARRIQQRNGRIIPISALSIGDCYDDVLGGGNVESVALIDCNRPHRNEVFAKLQIDLGPDVVYPGVTELRRAVGDRCKSQPFTDFVGAHFYSGSPLLVDTIFPSPATWARGDRSIICTAADPAGPVTGTMRNSERKPKPVEEHPLFPSPLPVHPVAPSPSLSPLAPPT